MEAPAGGGPGKRLASVPQGHLACAPRAAFCSLATGEWEQGSHRPVWLYATDLHVTLAQSLHSEPLFLRP